MRLILKLRHCRELANRGTHVSEKLCVQMSHMWYSSILTPRDRKAWTYESRLQFFSYHEWGLQIEGSPSGSRRFLMKIKTRKPVPRFPVFSSRQIRAHEAPLGVREKNNSFRAVERKWAGFALLRSFQIFHFQGFFKKNPARLVHLVWMLSVLQTEYPFILSFETSMGVRGGVRRLERGFVLLFICMFVYYYLWSEP